MSLELIDTPPARDTLTLLSNFQAETPSTFFGERPVLHFHSSSKLLISKSDLEENQPFWNLSKPSAVDWPDNAAEKAIPDVDVWALST